MNETSSAGTEQKAAIVTGATGGIGSAIVTAYRELGYVVVATSREMPDSEDPQVLAVSADLVEPDAGERDAGERIVGAAMDRFGRLDALVNSAGIYIDQPDSPPATCSDGWKRSTMSSKPSGTSSRRPSSPARFCTSTAARAPAAERA